MLRSVRAFVTLLILASLAGSAAPLCRCPPEPSAPPSAGAGHECCAPRTVAVWRAAACCPATPEALASAPTPEAPPVLAGALPVAALQPPVSVAHHPVFLAPSPPAPARSSSVLRV